MNAKKNLVSIGTSLVVLIIAASKVCSQQFKDDTCEPFNCIRVQACFQATENLAKGIYPKLCGFEGNEPLTCCVQPQQTSRDAGGSTRVATTMCRMYRREICPLFGPYVYGGEPAKPRELPGLASWVKLGDLDTSTDKDDAKPEIFRIVARFNHPQYKPEVNYNDIALYRLDRKVVFNDYIRPICLQTDDLEEDTQKAQVAGWGRIGFVERTSSKLLKVGVDLLNVSDCSKTASNDQLPRGIDADSMICAGAVSGGRDTCQGDSGGPLYSLEETSGCHLKTQYGVTSFGYQCGLEGYPGIYSKVFYHLDWIESLVWPSKNSDEVLVWQ
ncbi:hypothetical protein LSTR_LSTR010564 [Laodelphax striatellus]|uniref:Peptidase S1 domain-containing protein n=1 Tax=Laodelphax striatellus TaxID=195883 RepID=A0A482XIF7_LAOST|nr:hypothetical protein LSTR_LSTR010564 [Laodelphax striatellus]